MKVGGAMGGDEHDARELAQRLVDDARAEAERVRDAARTETNQLKHDAKQLAGRILADARAEAERITAHAQVDAARIREDSRPTRVAPASGEAASTRMMGGREAPEAAGRVDEVVGLVMRATVAGGALGEIVRIDRRDREPLAAEIVGFRGEQAVMLPLGELAGVEPAGAVWRTGEPLAVPCGDDVLGRVLDGRGAPIDGGPALRGERWAVDRAAPPALARPPISAPQPTGVRVIDALLTLGRGQRVAVFGAAGAGKSTLLAQIARGAAADVIVLCQVGERGRELNELLGDDLAPARARTVVVCATSDAPPMVRLRAASTATAIAEWFRERRGANVLLLVDSLSRVARAHREVGLAAGEPPARDGYPPSVFALLPRLIERAGATAAGVITAIYAVLAGDELDDEVRGLVDGHLVLDRRLAQRGQFPSIDVAASASHSMPRVVDAEHAEAAARVRARLADHLDDPAIDQLLRQRRDESSDWDTSIGALLGLQPR